MKAIQIHNYGGPETLQYEDAAMPQIAPDEVLVKVIAASVNPIDWKVRKGYMASRTKISFPFIPGWDVAGIVEKTGALITYLKKGDKVFARSDTSRNGSYAEYVAVRAADMAFAPESIPLKHAAGVPLAAQTAWTGLFEEGRLNKNQSVLIHGASGGVGTFAIQLAKLAGASKIIVTASADSFELVKSLGADEVIDYQLEDFSKKVKDIDLVFDAIGGDTQIKSLAIIKTGGTLVSTVGVDQKAADEQHVTAKGFFMMSNGARLQEIAGLIDAGKLKVIIDKEFPLTEVRAAHKLSESGHVHGKIIITVAAA
jgi:NADPH:quinone reductase-like Zn-dependent oxidoreductase